MNTNTKFVIDCEFDKFKFKSRPLCLSKSEDERGIILECLRDVDFKIMMKINQELLANINLYAIIEEKIIKLMSLDCLFSTKDDSNRRVTSSISNINIDLDLIVKFFNLRVNNNDVNINFDIKDTMNENHIRLTHPRITLFTSLENKEHNKETR